MFIAGAGDTFESSRLSAGWRRAVEARGMRVLQERSSPEFRFLRFGRASGLAGTASQIKENSNRFLILSGRLHYQSDLRRRLGPEAQDAAGDLELVESAVARFGESASQCLEGNYCVAFGGERHLTIFNDCVASSRMYFAQVGTSIVFGTYLPAILATSGLDTRIDGRCVAQLLGAHLPRGRTGFHAVRLLPGGSVLKWQPGSVSVSRWWKPKTIADSNFDAPEGAAAAVSEIFEVAVSEAIGTDQCVAATLSGGLDSTLVASFAADGLQRTGGSLHAFTSIPHTGLDVQKQFNWDANDWPYARLVADAYPNVRHASVYAGSPYPIQYMGRVHELSATPTRNVANAQWLSKIASEAALLGCRKVLTGFRGNFTVSCSRGNAALLSLLRAGKIFRLCSELMAQRRPLYRATGSLVKSAIFGVPPTNRAMQRNFLARQPLELTRFSAQAKDAIDEMTGQLVAASRDNYWKLVQMNMCFAPDWLAEFGVEFCDPTSDRRVMEAIFQLPDSAFLHKGFDRALARLMGAGVVPDPIRWRETRGQQSPEEAGYFELHAKDYLAAWKELDKQVMGQLIDPHALEGLLEQLVRGKGTQISAQFMHRFLDISFWMKNVSAEFGSSEMVFESPSKQDIDESMFA